MYRIVSFLGQILIKVIEWLFHLPPDKQHAEPEWIRRLCAQIEDFKSEFLALYDANLREFKEISEEQRRITKGNSWKIFILKAYGRSLAANCNRCPKTSKSCLSIPEITTVAFSVLEPGTHITPHRGIYAGVLRCLIPLIIPEGDCGIRVAETKYKWTSGQPVLFDDTIEHEAWNYSEARRVVLFIDYRKSLPLPLAILNKIMIRLIGFSPYIGRMLRASL
ncbi:MAG: aspartyl/asparaginyl beta-hydroxylase domain-containing protein [Spirochaetes bacterium]|nr:aspartyl/asparaginyl beta-hydroxylase domain-containing protein [Spirochaetota bacterium]